MSDLLTPAQAQPSASILARLASRDAHPIVQFVKYGMCGVAATIVHQGVFFALSYSLIPAGDGMVVDGAPISDLTRYWNGIINNALAFFPGVIVAYSLNVRWVFTPGRHSKGNEFAMFAFVAAIGNVAGIFGGPMLINWFGVATWVSQSTFVITSFLVNFLSRKFLIFQK